MPRKLLTQRPRYTPIPPMKHTAVTQMNRLGEKGEPFLFIIDSSFSRAEIMRPEEAARRGILFDFPGMSNAHAAPQKDAVLDASPMPYGDYLRAFSLVMEHLEAGNSYLATLTCRTPVQCSLGLEDIFFASRARFRLLFRNEFVMFSPERFISINGDTISAFPMKGTIDASVSGALERLMADEKEHAEHITVVDLLRNDLAMVSQNVRVDEFRFPETVRTRDRSLIQTSSRISGDLGEDWHSRIGDILKALLPAGSVTGAPKDMTVDILSRAEQCGRGWYTGICGIYDGNYLDSAVMIRFIKNDGGKYYYRSGGGITVYSDPLSEYREMNDKIYVPVC